MAGLLALLNPPYAWSILNWLKRQVTYCSEYTPAAHPPLDPIHLYNSRRSPLTPQASYSIDENLYHTSYESGLLEDPMTPPPPEMFKMTTDPLKVNVQYLRCCCCYCGGVVAVVAAAVFIGVVAVFVLASSVRQVCMCFFCCLLPMILAFGFFDNL